MPKDQAVCAREAADAVRAVHAARALAAGVEAGDAGRGRGVYADAAVGRVRVGGNAHAVGRVAPKGGAEPVKVGLHELRKVLRQVVAHLGAGVSCGNHGQVNGPVRKACGKGAVPSALVQERRRIRCVKALDAGVPEGPLVEDHVRHGRGEARHDLDELWVDEARPMPQRHRLRRAQHVGHGEGSAVEPAHAAGGKHHRLGTHHLQLV